MNTVIILNDPPYGTERSYNGLRLAEALAKRTDQSVRVFLMGDAAACAKSGQTTPQGYELLDGTKRSTLEELANLVLWADHLLVF